MNDRIAICANCDQTTRIDIHGKCTTCNSSSIMVIGNERAKSLSDVRVQTPGRRGNTLPFVLSKIQKRSA